MSALNPDQFFHGTTSAIKDGVVRPADSAGKDVSEYSFGDPGDMSEGDHAFAIRNDENYAWHAANTFHKNGRRPRVYEVDPAEDMKPGPWNKDHPNFLEHHEIDNPDDFHVAPGSDDERMMEGLRDDVETTRANHQDEWASKTGFPVRKRIDIMPGRQGTFPDVNWNRFRDGPRFGGHDANHPNDNQIAQGMNYRENHQDELRRNAVDDPPRRSGASLRAFMEGKPEPVPEPKKEATLF